MFAEWIIVGGLLFWGIIAVLSVVVVIAVHNRCEGFAFFVTGLFILACTVVGNLWPWIRANGASVLVCAVVYPLVGVAWSFPRWVLFLDKIKTEYKDRLAKFGELSRDKWNRWGDIINHGTFWDAGLCFNPETGKLTPPQFQNNKERISGWMLLWPWSMVDALLSELIIRFFRWLRDLLKRFYQAISDKMFSDIQ